MATKKGRALVVPEDNWTGIASAPRAQQDKFAGAIFRLFFEGIDEPPKGDVPKAAYYNCRKFFLNQRNKSVGQVNRTEQNDPKTDEKSDVLYSQDISLSNGEYISTEENQPGYLPQVEEIDSAFAAAALDAFTEETGKQCLMPERRVLRYLTRIHQRGFTIEDVRLVCQDRQKLWGKDPQFSQHIWPDTLFAPSHFDKYLASAKSNPGVKTDAEAAEFAGAF